MLKNIFLLEGTVVKGFGRGGKQLNCPTANIDINELDKKLGNVPNGVYYGWAKLDGKQGGIYKTAVSIGWNPYFKNVKKTVEPHLIHKFEEDFYGQHLKVLFCGYIREQESYDSLEALKAAIANDINKSKDMLSKKEFIELQSML